MSRTTLYGTPLSLFTGRARSYLIKAGIEYREISPYSSYFSERVLPKAGQRQGMPTVEMSDGTVIRDGAAIIDHFETSTHHQFSPSSPKQRIVSRLFDVIGAEGLLRPAMHYRWNFPAQNLEFLRFHFESFMPPSPQRAAQAEENANYMRAACRGFGVVPETFGLVESLYLELLANLDRHFAEFPYLLGGKPCIGDFGLIAPLYGHLARDPKPLSLMQERAIRLFRWVERMNRPEPDVGEFVDQDDVYLVDDVVPDTLIEVLKQIAIDFVPETKAAADCINQWIGEKTDLAPGTTARRAIRTCSFELRGITINAWAQPYRFFLLQRVQDEYQQLDVDEQHDVLALLSTCDMSDLLDIKLSRKIERSNNLEVWA